MAQVKIYNQTSTEMSSFDGSLIYQLNTVCNKKKHELTFSSGALLLYTLKLVCFTLLFNASTSYISLSTPLSRSKGIGSSTGVAAKD